MSEGEIDELLREQGVGILSMARDGVPYGIPMSFGYDSDGYAYFLLVGHSQEGKKLQYAEATDEASLLVYDVGDDGGWQSAIVTGTLGRITVGMWDSARAAMADNAFQPDLLTDTDLQDDPRVWALDVTSKSGRMVPAAD